MCEQTEINYLDGDVVWVKVGGCWWPGQVVGFENLPEEIQAEFTKKALIAAVKFFQEDTFEYVKNYQQIYKYNCTQKDEFIRKGLDKYRSKLKDGSSYMSKFPEDVEKAESITGGEPGIIFSDKFSPAEKPDISSLFGEKKVPKKKRDDRRSEGAAMSRQITHPRFLRHSDHEVRIREQIVKSPNTHNANSFRCCLCTFTSTRVNVLIEHFKAQQHGDQQKKKSPTKLVSKAKSKQFDADTPKRKYVKKEKSGSSKKSDAGSELKKRKLGKTPDKNIKKKKLNAQEERKRIQDELLEDWNDDFDVDMKADLNPEAGFDLNSTNDTIPIIPSVPTSPTKSSPVKSDIVVTNKEETDKAKPEEDDDNLLQKSEELLSETKKFLDNPTSGPSRNTKRFIEKLSDKFKSKSKLFTSNDDKTPVESEDKKSKFACFEFNEDDVPETPTVQKPSRFFLKKDMIKEYQKSEAIKNEKERHSGKFFNRETVIERTNLIDEDVNMEKNSTSLNQKKTESTDIEMQDSRKVDDMEIESQSNQVNSTFHKSEKHTIDDFLKSDQTKSQVEELEIVEIFEVEREEDAEAMKKSQTTMDTEIRSDIDKICQQFSSETSENMEIKTDEKFREPFLNAEEYSSQKNDDVSERMITESESDNLDTFRSNQHLDSEMNIVNLNSNTESKPEEQIAAENLEAKFDTQEQEINFENDSKFDESREKFDNTIDQKIEVESVEVVSEEISEAAIPLIKKRRGRVKKSSLIETEVSKEAELDKSSTEFNDQIEKVEQELKISETDLNLQTGKKRKSRKQSFNRSIIEEKIAADDSQSDSEAKILETAKPKGKRGRKPKALLQNKEIESQEILPSDNVLEESQVVTEENVVGVEHSIQDGIDNETKVLNNVKSVDPVKPRRSRKQKFQRPSSQEKQIEEDSDFNQTLDLDNKTLDLENKTLGLEDSQSECEEMNLEKKSLEVAKPKGKRGRKPKKLPSQESVLDPLIQEEIATVAQSGAEVKISEEVEVETKPKTKYERRGRSKKFLPKEMETPEEPRFQESMEIDSMELESEIKIDSEDKEQILQISQIEDEQQQKPMEVVPSEKLDFETRKSRRKSLGESSKEQIIESDISQSEPMEGVSVQTKVKPEKRGKGKKSTTEVVTGQIEDLGLLETAVVENEIQQPKEDVEVKPKKVEKRGRPRKSIPEVVKESTPEQEIAETSVTEDKIEEPAPMEEVPVEPKKSERRGRGKLPSTEVEENKIEQFSEVQEPIPEPIEETPVEETPVEVKKPEKKRKGRSAMIDNMREQLFQQLSQSTDDAQIETKANDKKSKGKKAAAEIVEEPEVIREDRTFQDQVFQVDCHLPEPMKELPVEIKKSEKKGKVKKPTTEIIESELIQDQVLEQIPEPESDLQLPTKEIQPEQKKPEKKRGRKSTIDIVKESEVPEQVESNVSEAMEEIQPEVKKSERKGRGRKSTTGSFKDESFQQLLPENIVDSIVESEIEAKPEESEVESKPKEAKKPGRPRKKSVEVKQQISDKESKLHEPNEAEVSDELISHSRRGRRKKSSSFVADILTDVKLAEENVQVESTPTETMEIEVPVEPKKRGRKKKSESELEQRPVVEQKPKGKPGRKKKVVQEEESLIQEIPQPESNVESEVLESTQETDSLERRMSELMEGEKEVIQGVEITEFQPAMEIETEQVSSLEVDSVEIPSIEVPAVEETVTTMEIENNVSLDQPSETVEVEETVDTTEVVETTEIVESTEIFETTPVVESVEMVETTEPNHQSEIVETTEVVETTEIIETTEIPLPNEEEVVQSQDFPKEEVFQSKEETVESKSPKSINSVVNNVEKPRSYSSFLDLDMLPPKKSQIKKFELSQIEFLENEMANDKKSLETVKKVDDIGNMELEIRSQSQTDVFNEHEEVVQAHTEEVQCHTELEDNTVVVQGHEEEVQSHEEVVQDDAVVLKSHDDIVQAHEEVVQSHVEVSQPLEEVLSDETISKDMNVFDTLSEQVSAAVVVETMPQEMNQLSGMSTVKGFSTMDRKHADDEALEKEEQYSMIERTLEQMDSVSPKTVKEEPVKKSPMTTRYQGKFTPETGSRNKKDKDVFGLDKNPTFQDVFIKTLQIEKEDDNKGKGKKSRKGSKKKVSDVNNESLTSKADNQGKHTVIPGLTNLHNQDNISGMTTTMGNFEGVEVVVGQNLEVEDKSEESMETDLVSLARETKNTQQENVNTMTLEFKYEEAAVSTPSPSSDISVPVKKREKPRIIENVALKEPMILKSKLLEKLPPKAMKHKLDSDSPLQGAPRAKIIKLDTTSPVKKKKSFLKSEELVAAKVISTPTPQKITALSISEKCIQQSSQSLEDMDLDINNMPFVLSEDVLTPESIENMPVVISGMISSDDNNTPTPINIIPETSFPVSEVTTISTDQASSSNSITVSSNSDSPVLKKKIAAPAILKNKVKGKPTITSIRTIVPPLTTGVKNVQFQNAQSGKTTTYISQKETPEKYVIVHSAGGQQGRYKVQAKPGTSQKIVLPSNKSPESVQIIQQDRKLMIIPSQNVQQKMIPLNVAKQGGKVQRILSHKGEITTVMSPNYGLSKTVITQKADSNSPTTSKVSGPKIINPRGIITHKGTVTPIPVSINKYTSISTSPISVRSLHSKNNTILSTSLGSPKNMLTSLPQTIVSPKGTVLTPITGQQVKALAGKAPQKGGKLQYPKVPISLIQKTQLASMSQKDDSPVKISGTKIVCHRKGTKQIIQQSPPALITTSNESIEQRSVPTLVNQRGKFITSSALQKVNLPKTPVRQVRTPQKIIRKSRDFDQESSPQNAQSQVKIPKIAAKTQKMSLSPKTRGRMQKNILSAALSSITTTTSSTSYSIPGLALPPLEPINQDKKPKIEEASEQVDAQQEEVDQEMVGNEAAEPKITNQPQIIALPIENSDGTLLMLMTTDDNNTLMSLEGTLDNIVLQYDNGTVSSLQTAVSEANQSAMMESFPSSEIVQTSSQDILAAALANSDFQQEIGLPETPPSSVMSTGLTQTSLINQTILQSTIIPPTEPISSPSVLETSLTLNQPIMTPLEVPSSMPIQSESIPTSIPSLPITITNPNISFIAGEVQIQIPGNSMPDIGEMMETSTSEQTDDTPVTQYLVIPGMDEGVTIQAQAENKHSPTVSYSVSIPENMMMESSQGQTTPSMPIIDDSYVEDIQYNASIETSTANDQSFADVPVSEMLVSKASTVSETLPQDIVVSSEMVISSQENVVAEEAVTTNEEISEDVYTSHQVPVSTEEQILSEENCVVTSESNLEAESFNASGEEQVETSQIEHSEVEESQVQIEHSGIEIEDSQVQIEHSNIEIEDSQIQIEDSQVQIEDSQVQIEHSSVEIEDSHVDHSGIEVENTEVDMEIEPEMEISHVITQDECHIHHESSEIENQREDVEISNQVEASHDEIETCHQVEASHEIETEHKIETVHEIETTQEIETTHEIETSHEIETGHEISTPEEAESSQQLNSSQESEFNQDIAESQNVEHQIQIFDQVESSYDVDTGEVLRQPLEGLQIEEKPETSNNEHSEVLPSHSLEQMNNVDDDDNMEIEEAQGDHYILETSSTSQADALTSHVEEDHSRLRDNSRIIFEDTVTDTSQEAPSQSYGRFDNSMASDTTEVPSQSAKSENSREPSQSMGYEAMETDEIVSGEPPTQSFEDSKTSEATQSYEALADVSTDTPTQSFNEIGQCQSERISDDDTADDQSFPTQSYEVGKMDNLSESMETDPEISQEGNIPSQSNDIGTDGIGTSSVSTNNSNLNEDETASSSYVPETPETQERDQDQESAISTSSYEIPPCEELNIASSSIPDTSEHSSIHDNGILEIPTSSYSLNPDSSSTHVDSVPTSSFEDQVILEQNVSTSYDVPISMPRLDETSSQNFVTESSDRRNEPTSYFREATASYYGSVHQDPNSRLIEDPQEEVTPSYYGTNPQDITSEASQSYFAPEEATPSYTSHNQVSPSYYDPPPEGEASQSYYSSQDSERTEQSSQNMEASQSFYQEDELRLRQRGGEATPTYSARYPVEYASTNSPLDRHDLVESSVPATRPTER